MDLLIIILEKITNFYQPRQLFLNDKHFILYLGNYKINTLTAENIYQQSLDKQRIVIVGEGSALIMSLVVHALSFFNRKFDCIRPGKPDLLDKSSPLILIQAQDQLLDYKHHIAVLTDLSSGDLLDAYAQLADATPKGGSLLYPELNVPLKKVGSKERPDVQALAYSKYKHEVKDGKTTLVSSTGERYTISLSGDKNLEYISAAKELLKKIGISSGQFYKAISTYSA